MAAVGWARAVVAGLKVAAAKWAVIAAWVAAATALAWRAAPVPGHNWALNER